MTKAQLLVTHAELVASSAYLVAMAKVVACDSKRNVMTPADLVSVAKNVVSLGKILVVKMWAIALMVTIPHYRG